MQFNQNMIGNNSIKNFNSFFNSEMKALDINFNEKGLMDFDNVLMKEMQSRNAIPQGPIINTGIQMNVGLENMGISPLARIDSSVDQAVSRNTGKMSAVEKTADSIGKALGNSLNAVNDAEHAAHHAAETFAAGGDISVHEVMLASQKANLTMQMALQLRNKLVNAYTEINNVRV